MIRRIHSSGHVLANIGIRFVLGTDPPPCLDPPNQNGTIVKGRQMRRENKLGKIQPKERYYEMVFVFRRATGLCE